ncbi:MAG: serine/threonine protein phosphatase [Ruminococcus sp.]|nr:serine/threonine protein phosphatase [Ruminococcus sp.]
MKIGRRKRNAQAHNTAVVQTVPKEKTELNGFVGFERQSKAERELYASLREAVPIIDAAICKLVRLIGSFEISAKNKEVKLLADSLMKNVRTNGSSKGIEGFLYSYFDSLLTYGSAVGEMIAGSGGIEALYNASLDDVEITAGKSPLDLIVCRRDLGLCEPVKYQDMVIVSLLNPKPGTVCGTSVLSGLPFVGSILLRIFSSIKTNWERIGDVRFAVTYNPDQNSGGISKESAAIIADEWRKAMRSDSVCDFVAVGDVSVKVIGAENQMPDCDIPIRHITEQIIAKLGLPPFLLGLSWSSTERMSEQQADILTSELEYYRALLEPVITKIVNMHLRLNGYTDSFEIVWNDINLQDAVELSQARLNNAQALQLEKEIGLEGACE